MLSGAARKVAWTEEPKEEASIHGDHRPIEPHEPSSRTGKERAAGFLRLVSNKFVRSLSNKSTDIVRQSTELVRRGSRNVREVASRVAAAVFPGRKKKNQPRRIADASPARPGILRRTKKESLVNPATEVQISQTGQILKMEAMMGLRKAFREMEPDQDGLVPYRKLEGTGRLADNASIFSHRNLEAHMKSSPLREKIFQNRKTFQDRAYNGMFNFQDMLRISYPGISPEEIEKVMDIVLRHGPKPEKTKLKHFSRKEQDMATAVYADILRRAGGIPEDGTVSLDNLENFLIEEFPGSSPYDILKSIEKDTRDRLYAGTPMLKEECLLWILHSGETWGLLSSKNETLVSIYSP